MLIGCSHSAWHHRQPVVSLRPISRSHLDKATNSGVSAFRFAFAFISFYLCKRVQKIADCPFLGEKR